MQAVKHFEKLDALFVGECSDVCHNLCVCLLKRFVGSQRGSEVIVCKGRSWTYVVMGSQVVL